MSYTVIARRYRPQNFEEIIGQSAIATTLQNAIKEKKVSHAYIFAGDRGVGKTSMARIIAKALNCQNGPTPTPCNKCEFCNSISAGNDPDVIEIDAASQTKVDDVRVLQEGVGYVPLRARYKIYIMDEAHQLSRHAFNALLKTIEEPPPHVKFIFATTEPHKLPDTIISRCQRFNFRRITPQDIYLHLEKICHKEKVSIDKVTLTTIAQVAGGSMRDAETILDQLISFTSGKIENKDIESLLGAVALDQIFEIVDAVKTADFNRLIQLVDNVFQEGKDISVFLDQLIEHCWRLILVLVSPPDSPLIMREIIHNLNRYQAQAKLFRVEQLLNYVTQIAEARTRLRETSNVRILVELTVLKLVSRDAEPPRIQQKETVTKPSLAASTTTRTSLPSKGAYPKKTEQLPVDKPVSLDNTKTITPSQKEQSETKPDLDKVKEEPEVYQAPLSLEEFQGHWSGIYEMVKQVSPQAFACFRESRLVSVNNQEMVIGFPRQCNFHRTMLEDVKYKGIVEDIIKKITGRDLGLSLIMLDQDKSSAGMPDTKGMDARIDMYPDKNAGSYTQNKKNSALIEELLANPIIRRVQEQFQARPIDAEEIK